MLKRLLDYYQNKTVNRHRYRTHSQAIILMCYDNRLTTPARKKAFLSFYHSVKHLPHKVVEIVQMGDKLETGIPYDMRIASNKAMQEEVGLNELLLDLPSQYKYVFWVQEYVEFTNLNWLTDACYQLEMYNMVQPFERYTKRKGMSTVHTCKPAATRWSSFACNYLTCKSVTETTKRCNHGYTGVIWGVTRRLIDKYGFCEEGVNNKYDLLAYAASKQLSSHPIIKNETWSKIPDWYFHMEYSIAGRLGFVEGNVHPLERNEIVEDIGDDIGDSHYYVDRQLNN